MRTVRRLYERLRSQPHDHRRLPTDARNAARGPVPVLCHVAAVLAVTRLPASRSDRKGVGSAGVRRGPRCCLSARASCASRRRHAVAKPWRLVRRFGRGWHGQELSVPRSCCGTVWCARAEGVQGCRRPEAEGSLRHPLARSARAASRRLVSALRHHLGET